jgi:hypothetical protein
MLAASGSVDGSGAVLSEIAMDWGESEPHLASLGPALSPPLPRAKIPQPQLGLQWLPCAQSQTYSAVQTSTPSVGPGKSLFSDRWGGCSVSGTSC